MTTSKSADLSRDLSEGIANGSYPVGALLPTEFEMCERYGLSRYAVRKALDELQELGLISRRKNVGTRVEAARPSIGFTHSIATVSELTQFGATHVRVVRSVDQVVMSLSLARETGCVGGSSWLKISSLRMDDAKRPRPLCWTDVYIDPAYQDVAEKVQQSPQTLISALIEEHHGRRIARVRQDIQAMLVPKTLCDVLRVDAGTPALKVVRRYFDPADEVFEVSVSVHPADRFTFSMDLSRSRD